MCLTRWAVINDHISLISKGLFVSACACASAAFQGPEAEAETNSIRLKSTVQKRCVEMHWPSERKRKRGGRCFPLLPAAWHSKSEPFFVFTHFVAQNYNLTATVSPPFLLLVRTHILRRRVHVGGTSPFMQCTVFISSLSWPMQSRVRD